MEPCVGDPDGSSTKYCGKMGGRDLVPFSGVIVRERRSRAPG